jgi:hypothetical protein
VAGRCYGGDADISFSVDAREAERGNPLRLSGVLLIWLSGHLVITG